MSHSDPPCVEIVLPPAENANGIDASPTTTTSNSDNIFVNEPTTLWVGNIPQEVTSTADIAAIFSVYGELKDVQLKRTNDVVKYPMNYAFVKFNRRQDAEKAYEDCQIKAPTLEFNTEKVSLLVGKAKINTTLHVSNLCPTILKQTLHEMFGSCGDLCPGENAVMIHKGANGVSSIYATVSYNSKETADEARIKYNGYMLNGRALKVQWNKKKRFDESISSLPLRVGGTHKSTVSIYIQFESAPGSITEESLGEIFEPFGNVTGVYIKTLHEEGGRQHGYGFVHFTQDEKGHSCAKTTAKIIGCHGKFSIQGVKLRCEVSRNFAQIMSSYTSEDTDSTRGNAAIDSSPTSYDKCVTMPVPAVDMNKPPPYGVPFYVESGNMMYPSPMYLPEPFYGYNEGRYMYPIRPCVDEIGLAPGASPVMYPYRPTSDVYFYSNNEYAHSSHPASPIVYYPDYQPVNTVSKVPK
jgi:RNA recognition motif-containing protein